jgi:hypothetical protein
MAGQKELIIKLIILTVILVALGVGGYFGYKYYQEECPDGLFVCMGIDDADADADAGGAGPGGAGPGGSDGRTTTPLGDRSPDFVECTRYFDEEDKTKTCYDAGGGKGGLRWFWSNTVNGKKCLKKTKYYKIEASSAVDDHKTVYTYDKPGGNSNGLIFTDATHITNKGSVKMNMKFNITPLDENKKALADPLIGQELNPGDNTTDCSSIGVTPVKFSSIFKPPPSAADTPPPPPPPVDCEGTWSEFGACLNASGAPVGCEEIGTKTKTRNITTGNEAKYGGTCKLTVSEGCDGGKCPADTPVEKLPPKCLYSPDYYDLAPADGIYYSDSQTGVQSCSNPCGGGTKTVYKLLNNTTSYRPEACSGQYKEKRSCNTQGCPVDCVESTLPTDKQCHTSNRKSNKGGTTYDHSYYRVNKHTINTAPKDGGKACAGISNQYTKAEFVSLDRGKRSSVPNNTWKEYPCSKLPSTTFP